MVTFRPYFSRASRLVSAALCFVILSATTVLAQAAPAGDAQPPAASFGETFSRMLPMFVIVFMIFYFLIMKPQQDKLKNQKRLLDSLQKGEQVVTSSGIIGKVVGNEKDFVLLEISNNVRIRLEPAHIARKLEKESGESKGN